MAEDHSQNMDVFGTPGARLGRPARARARHDARVDGWRDSKANTHRIDWQHAGRHAVHAAGPTASTTARRTWPSCPAAQIIDPAKVPSGTHLGGRSPATTSAARRPAGHNLDIALPRSPTVPAGTPVTLTLQVALGHRVGLRLRLRAGLHRRRQDLHVARRRRRATRRRQARTRTRTPARASTATGSPARAARTRPARRPIDRVRRRLRRPARSSTTRTTSAPWPARAGVAALHATRPTRASRGRAGSSTTSKVTAGDQVARTRQRLRARPSDPAIFNGGCREALQTRRAVHRRLAVPSAPTDGSPGRPRLLPGDARPLGLRRRRPRPGRPRRRLDVRARASTSSTPTRPTATATSAPTTRRRSRRSTPSPSPGQRDAEPRRRGVQGRRATSFSDDAATGHVDNYTDPSQADGNWTFAFGCLGFNVSRWPATTSGPRLAGAGRPDRRRRASPSAAAAATFDYGYGGGSNAVSVPGVDLTPKR